MRAVIAAIAALALSACGTLEENWPTAAEIAPYNSGASGLIVLDDINRGCTSVWLKYQEAQGTKTHYRFVREGTPAAIVVAPGPWRLTEVDCMSDDYEEFPNAVLWFDEVNVGPGEVVYTGSVQVDTVAVQKKSGAITQLLTLGLLGDNETDVFPVYSVKDNTDAVRQKLLAVSPDAASKMITRLLPQVLSKEAITRAYQNAYMPKPDGAAPTQQEVSAKLKVEMDTAFDTSIREYLARQNPAPARVPGAVASPSPQ